MTAYSEGPTVNDVSFCSEAPLSPKFILPIPSDPKHMEKEFGPSPWLAKMLGTDKSSVPSPSRPFGAIPSRKIPVSFLPQLKQNERVRSQGLHTRSNFNDQIPSPLIIKEKVMLYDFF